MTWKQFLVDAEAQGLKPDDRISSIDVVTSAAYGHTSGIIVRRYTSAIDGLPSVEIGGTVFTPPAELP